MAAIITGSIIDQSKATVNREKENLIDDTIADPSFRTYLNQFIADSGIPASERKQLFDSILANPKSPKNIGIVTDIANIIKDPSDRAMLSRLRRANLDLASEAPTIGIKQIGLAFPGVGIDIAKGVEIAGRNSKNMYVGGGPLGMPISLSSHKNTISAVDKHAQEVLDRTQSIIKQFKNYNTSDDSIKSLTDSFDTQSVGQSDAQTIRGMSGTTRALVINFNREIVSMPTTINANDVEDIKQQLEPAIEDMIVRGLTIALNNSTRMISSRNKYTSISGGGLLSSGVDSVISRIDNGLIGRGYQTVGNYVEDAYNAAQRGYKIVMAEAGIAKQLLRGGAAYSYDEMGNVAVTVNSPFVSRNDRYSAGGVSLGRYDPNQDYYFKCGDYFLAPLFHLFGQCQETHGIVPVGGRTRHIRAGIQRAEDHIGEYSGADQAAVPGYVQPVRGLRKYGQRYRRRPIQAGIGEPFEHVQRSFRESGRVPDRQYVHQPKPACQLRVYVRIRRVATSRVAAYRDTHAVDRSGRYLECHIGRCGQCRNDRYRLCRERITITAMTGNYFECGNEVIVEGFSLGHFSSFNVSNSRDVIGATAEIKIPLYTISVTDKQRPVADSLRNRRRRSPACDGSPYRGLRVV